MSQHSDGDHTGRAAAEVFSQLPGFCDELPSGYERVVIGKPQPHLGELLLGSALVSALEPPSPEHRSLDDAS